MIVQSSFPHWTVEAIPLDDPAQLTDRFLCYYAPSADVRNVLYSLHGLLVLAQHHGFFVICNPTTRQWTNLPELGQQSYCAVFECGFYFHSFSGEYRLLCHAVEIAPEEYNNRFDPDTKRYYYILSAGAILPRRLGRAPSSPGNLSYEVPVAHRGTLHWLSKHPQANRTGKMLAFDTTFETFRLMSGPLLDDTMRTTLFELDGELGVAAMQSLTSLDIWVLQDYKAETWTLRHRVDVPMPIFHYHHQISVSKVISVGNGAILIGAPTCEVARMYHLKEKRVICRDFTFNVARTATFLVFNESLVPHTFFDSPRCPNLETIYFSIKS
ncbi:hypothetical protein VPH35_087766 [Triticum aestivum]